jgi:uncharacterized membrane protein YhhN
MITPKLAGGPRPTDRAPGRRPVLWVLAAAFAVCSVLDLAAEAFGWDASADVFRTFALPLLIGCLFAARPPISRTITLLIGGLLFSWLGDTVGEVGFIVKIGLFLVAQWFFIGAFWPYRAGSLLRKPLALAGYAVLLVVLVAVLIRPAGELAVPVMVYGTSLVAMAVLASGLNRWGTIGGLCFVVSDTLLGMDRFYALAMPDLMDFLIMLSYLVAEVLLVVAAVTAVRNRYDHRQLPDSRPS